MTWDDSGYDLSDPKHPTFMDRWADWSDMERKRRKEDALWANEPPQDQLGVNPEWQFLTEELEGLD